MTYPPYCIACNSINSKIDGENTKNQLCWNADFSGEDYGFEGVECVIGVYSCMHEDCGATYEIVDFIFSDKEDQRVIKYYRNYDKCTNTQKERMISNCIYCSTKLVAQGKRPSHDNHGTIFECDGITTELQCPNCKTGYEVVDTCPVDELPINNDDLEIYESRTIFLK